MVQGSLKKLASKTKKASVANRQAKVTRKGKRTIVSGSATAKAKKKLTGCYTAGLERNIVGRMNPSEREKLKHVNTDQGDKPLTKAEAKSHARQARRNKKKVCLAFTLL